MSDNKLDNNNQQKAVIEAAIIAGAWSILIMVVLFTPLLFISVFILPLPIALMVMRRGLSITLIFTMAALLLAVTMNLFIPALFLIIYSIIVGITSGYSYQNKHDPGTCYGLIVLAIISSQIIMVALLVSFTNNTIFAQITQIMEESVASSEQLLLGWGLVQSAAEIDVNAAVSLLQLMLPTLVISSSIVIGYGYFYVLRYLNEKHIKRYQMDKLPSIASFRLPKSILWYYIGGLLTYLMFITYEHEKGYIYMLVFNYLQIVSFALAVQGIGLLWYYMKYKNWNVWLRVPLVILLMHPILLQLMTWVGMFDTIFNWRKIADSFSANKDSARP